MTNKEIRLQWEKDNGMAQTKDRLAFYKRLRDDKHNEVQAKNLEDAIDAVERKIEAFEEEWERLQKVGEEFEQLRQEYKKENV